MGQRARVVGAAPISLAVALLFACGCGGDDSASAGDASVGPSDASLEDGSTFDASSDASPDSGAADATLGDAAPDAAPDASVDGAVDAGGDSAVLDAGGDSSVLDASADAPADVSADAAPDAPPDAPVDTTPPTVTITAIFKRGTAPGAQTVTYPSPVAGNGYTTGYDGSHFLVGDTIHVRATATDPDSAIDTTSLQVRLDGFANGNVVAGTPFTLASGAPNNLVVSCAAMSCTIDFDLSLRGPFEPGTAIAAGFGVAVSAADPAGNRATSAATPVAATRFWWSRQLASTSVAGLAVHPNGDVIVSANAAGNADTVFALHADGPLDSGVSSGCANGATGVHWCVGHDFYGAGFGLGAIGGAPAIGDDVTGQLVYVTTGGGDVVALNGSGAKAWNCARAAFGAQLGAAAVTTSAVGVSASCEAVVFASTNSPNLYAVCRASGVCARAAAALADTPTTPVAVLGSTYYVGTAQRVAADTISGTTGNFTAPSYFGSGLGAISGLASDGTFLYAASNQAGKLYQFAANATPGFTALFGSLSPQGAPVVRAADVVSSDSGGGLRTMPLSSSGTISPGSLAGVARPSFTPLLGSDGRIYVGSQSGVVTAIDEASGAQSWTFSGATSSDFSVAPTMDCAGHLFAAAGDTVYAFITDAGGLRATSWPKYQRDARNSGNADRTASNGVAYGAFNGTSCVQ